MINTTVLSVGTTPVELTAFLDQGGLYGERITVMATSGAPIFVGGPNVTATQTPGTVGAGWPIAIGGSFEDKLSQSERMFAVTGSGTAVVNVYVGDI